MFHRYLFDALSKPEKFNLINQNISKSLAALVNVEHFKTIINVIDERLRLDLDVEDHQNIKNVFGNMIKKSYPASVTWSTFHRNICKYGHSISKIAPINDQ
jgi:hypothetical protein